MYMQKGGQIFLCYAVAPCIYSLELRSDPNNSVILRSETTKNPVNRSARP